MLHINLKCILLASVIVVLNYIEMCCMEAYYIIFFKISKYAISEFFESSTPISNAYFFSMI